MPQRIQFYEKKDLDAIHDATVDILSTIGIQFQGEEDRKLFQAHGFKVVGEQVFITENQLMDTIKGAHSSVKVQARNPKFNRTMGGEDFMFSPIYGTSSYVDENGKSHDGTLAFYEKMCKIVQTSDMPLTTPQGSCWPQDVPAEFMVLEMLYRDVTLTERPMLLTPTEAPFIIDAYNIASIIFGGYDYVMNNPVCYGASNNPLTPLAWSAHQAEGIRTMAAHNQPFGITNMMILGATAPVDIPSALVVANAELLAGIMLGRLVSKKSGIIYGTTACPLDMKSMVAILGAPEAMLMTRGCLALADYYGFPGRGGGCLTDSHIPDSAAMIDSALITQHALYAGANYCLHSLGMLGSYIASSLEKFVLDEESTRLAIASMKLPEISAKTINLDMIKRVGTKSDYLTQKETLKAYKNLFRSKFLNRDLRSSWEDRGSKTAMEMAHEEVEKRLKDYVKPEMDPKMEQAITEYVKARRNGRPPTKLT